MPSLKKVWSKKTYPSSSSSMMRLRICSIDWSALMGRYLVAFSWVNGYSIRPVSSITMTCLGASLSDTVIKITKPMKPNINRGVRKVESRNDFVCTRVLYSRLIISQIFEKLIISDLLCVIGLVNLPSLTKQRLWYH